MKSPGRRNLKSTSLLGVGAIRIRYILLLSLLGLFLFCGCNKTPPADEQRLVCASSYALSRTGARSGIAASRQCTGPCGTSTSPHASCGSSASAASSSPPPPKVYTVPSGTTLTVRISQDLSSKTSNVGDPFSGTLAQSIRVEGVTVLKAGAPVSGTVIAAHKTRQIQGGGRPWDRAQPCRFVRCNHAGI